MTDSQRNEMLQRLRNLADRRVNDAVKLALLQPDQFCDVDHLDLTGLVELKRSEKSFEAKFVDQIKVLEMMCELMNSNSNSVQDFFQALNPSPSSDAP